MIETKPQFVEGGVEIDNSVATASMPETADTEVRPMTEAERWMLYNASLPQVPKEEPKFYNPCPLDEPFIEPKGIGHKVGRVLTSPIEGAAIVARKVGEALSGVFSFLSSFFR